MEERAPTSSTAAVPAALQPLFADIQRLGPLDGDVAIARRGLGWLTQYVREVPRRRRFLKLYGWAVPTPVAVAAIRDFVGERRLLEVGAGNGLWAHLLSAYGVTVTATDDFSWTTPSADVNPKSLPNGFAVEMGRFHAVERLDAVGSVRKYADHAALLLCWPPPERPMAREALQAFQGDRVVYIGEWRRATADAAFHSELEGRWQRRDAIALPSWPSLHDSVFLYERKAERWAPPPAGRRANPHLMSQ